MSATELVERAQQARSEAEADIDAATTLDELTEIDRRYLGKGSPLNTVREAIKTVDGPDRASVGQAVSAARAVIEEKIEARRDGLPFLSVRTKPVLVRCPKLSILRPA